MALPVDDGVAVAVGVAELVGVPLADCVDVIDAVPE